MLSEWAGVRVCTTVTEGRPRACFPPSHPCSSQEPRIGPSASSLDTGPRQLLRGEGLSFRTKETRHAISRVPQAAQSPGSHHPGAPAFAPPGTGMLTQIFLGWGHSFRTRDELKYHLLRGASPGHRRERYGYPTPSFWTPGPGCVSQGALVTLRIGCSFLHTRVHRPPPLLEFKFPKGRGLIPVSQGRCHCMGSSSHMLGALRPLFPQE